MFAGLKQYKHNPDNCGPYPGSIAEAIKTRQNINYLFKENYKGKNYGIFVLIRVFLDGTPGEPIYIPKEKMTFVCPNSIAEMIDSNYFIFRMYKETHNGADYTITVNVSTCFLYNRDDATEEEKERHIDFKKRYWHYVVSHSLVSD